MLIPSTETKNNYLTRKEQSRLQLSSPCPIAAIQDCFRELTMALPDSPTLAFQCRAMKSPTLPLISSSSRVDKRRGICTSRSISISSRRLTSSQGKKGSTSHSRHIHGLLKRRMFATGRLSLEKWFKVQICPLHPRPDISQKSMKMVVMSRNKSFPMSFNLYQTIMQSQNTPQVKILQTTSPKSIHKHQSLSSL